MKLIKSILSFFMAALAVLTVWGFFWWGHPPEALAKSADGGRVILVLTLVACLVGLWRLWVPSREEPASH